MLPDHFYLRREDRCFYFGDYTARAGYDASPTNSLIFNLKKNPARKDNPSEWRWKKQAIASSAEMLIETFREENLARCFFVPIPPAKNATHAEFDDRMAAVLREVERSVQTVHWGHILVQGESRPAAHCVSAGRPRPCDYERAWSVCADRLPRRFDPVVILDDLLVTGAQYRAAKTLLQDLAPQAEIVGVFLARRVPVAGTEGGMVE